MFGWKKVALILCVLCIHTAVAKFWFTNQSDRPLHIITSNLPVYILEPNKHQGFTTDTDHIIVGWPYAEDKLNCFAITIKDGESYELHIAMQGDQEFLDATLVPGQK